MTAWWRDLSIRERMLIMAAGALASVFFVSLFIIRPLEQWREDASARALEAREGYDLVASAAAIGSSETSTAPQYDVPLRQAVTFSANDSQINLIRIGAVANGQIEVQSEPVSGEQLFQWLGFLETQYGVRAVFVDINRAEEGAVNAQVLVLERSE